MARLPTPHYESSETAEFLSEKTKSIDFSLNLSNAGRLMFLLLFGLKGIFFCNKHALISNRSQLQLNPKNSKQIASIWQKK